jgi:hypothetical protein
MHVQMILQVTLASERLVANATVIQTLCRTDTLIALMRALMYLQSTSNNERTVTNITDIWALTSV